MKKFFLLKMYACFLSIMVICMWLSGDFSKQKLHMQSASNNEGENALGIEHDANSSRNALNISNKDNVTVDNIVRDLLKNEQLDILQIKKTVSTLDSSVLNKSALCTKP